MTKKLNPGLVSIVGAACAGVLCSYVPQFEGTVLKGYKDPIGIVTACTGHTKTAVLGKPYSPAECETLLQADLIKHAEGALKCLTVPLTTGQRAAVISFAFNVGVARFCDSTMADKFNAGDSAGACNELLRWTRAGGKILPGLVNRRRIELDMCEGRIG